MIEPTAYAESSQATGRAEKVLDILDRELQVVIDDWLSRVEQDAELKSIPLDYRERTGHLPQLLRDVIGRLRLDTGSKASVSNAAGLHGNLRRTQGYTVALAVQESRLLQVSIFSTLHKNAKHLEFGTLLPYVVTIADEVDAQLKQQMLSFMAAETPKASHSGTWSLP
jgi:hypothetical protein